ncbi:unnamed protein product, partial [Brassica oleracea]
MRGFMFDILGHNSKMAGKEYVNFKRTRSDVFGNIRVQRKLLLEHGIKKKGMLTWGLTWGKEKM